MFTEPADLDRAEITRALNTHWSIGVTSFEYEPVGFGSQHWIATDTSGTRWFVTADRLSAPEDDEFQWLERAFRAAATLRAHGLDFVLAPVVSTRGAVLVRFGSAWALSVRPYIQAEPLCARGPLDRPSDRIRAAELVAELHAATPALTPDSVHHETFALPEIATLHETMALLDRSWTDGPYGEQARQLLRDSRQGVLTLIERYEAIADVANAQQTDWVITHGEPHGTNILVDEHDNLVLIDWDTAMIGPKERDLWMILDGKGAEWRAYHTKHRTADLRPEVLQLYKLQWAICEISGYTTRFRHLHGSTADDCASWTNLQSYLPVKL